MGILDFLKKKTIINFSDENISELTLKSDLLGQTLIENGMGFYVDYLSQIRLSADNKNDKEFRKLVLKSGLFVFCTSKCFILSQNCHISVLYCAPS